MIAVDNTFLTLMLHPSARPPLDPSTDLPVSQFQHRIELLIETLDEAREQIIIPTPVLSEFLMLAGNDGPRYLAEINRKSIFRIEAFDTRAAVELTAIELGIKAAKGRRAYKSDGLGGTWAKIKFDRQIVVIAKVNGASKIYSDDKGVENFATQCGIPVVKTWELPLPPQEAQESMFTLLETLERLGEETKSARAEEATEPAATGVSTVPRPSAAVSLSPEEGSGAGEGKAGIRTSPPSPAKG